MLLAIFWKICFGVFWHKLKLKFSLTFYILTLFEWYNDCYKNFTKTIYRYINFRVLSMSALTTWKWTTVFIKQQSLRHVRPTMNLPLQIHGQFVNQVRNKCHCFKEHFSKLKVTTKFVDFNFQHPFVLHCQPQ